VLAIYPLTGKNWGMQGSSDPNRELLDADALCRHLVAKGSVEEFLADHRHQLFPDDMFADLFPTGRGRPSVPADVVASVMVLQALGGLSDRDAAAQLRTDIGWKVATGLSLTDPGFHPTVLTLWRNKLRVSAAPERIFDAVRSVVAESGVIAGKQRRALDSTVLDDAVVRQDAIMQLVAQIRRVRRLVPQAKALELSTHDYDNDPGKPACAWDDQEAIDAMVSALVGDAQATLAAVAALQLDEAQSEAVGLLALVAGQDVEPGVEEGTWRIAPVTRPDRMVSVIDPDSRHVHKTNHNYRDGFKAHIAVEPDSGLVTACDLTPGNVGDGQAAMGLLAGEPQGTEVLADSAYGSADLRRALEAAEHTAVIKPMPLHHAIEGGFSTDDFVIDTMAGTATCPNGITVKISAGNTAIFGAKCNGCTLRQRCTKAKRGRQIKIHEHHDVFYAARRQAESTEFQDTYRRYRPMVERSIAWLVAKGNRRVTYRGIARNRIWLAHRCAAINFRRLVNLGLSSDGIGWTLAT
jgi:IS5 family transposase